MATLESIEEEASKLAADYGWKRDWKDGIHLLLESAEFIEALRGKGDPVREAGDVLLVLLSMLRPNHITLQELLDAAEYNIAAFRSRVI